MCDERVRMWGNGAILNIISIHVYKYLQTNTHAFIGTGVH